MARRQAFTNAVRAARHHRLRRDLGDVMADFFESLGITKDRYKAAKAAMRLKATCGCDARRQWLNDLGESLGIIGTAAKLAAWTLS